MRREDVGAMSWELIIWTCIVARRRNNIGIDYVPAKMAVYGVFRPQLIPYDVQWRGWIKKPLTL
jgi:hypothetical protein